MSYTKTIWKNGVTGVTDVNLNNMENGIEALDRVVPNLSNPNLLINGDFQVWQRGSSFAPSTGYNYTSDRWALANSVASGGTATSVNEGIQIKNLTGEYTSVYQFVEVTNYMRNLLNTSMFTFSANIDGIVYTLTGKIGLDVYSLAIPDGTMYLYKYQNNNKLDLAVRIDVKNQKTKIIKWAKLEVGTIATPFTPKTYAEELNMCQRYYEKSYLMAVPPASDNGYGRYMISKNPNDGAFYGTVPFKVVKRTTPTLTTYKTNGSLLDKGGITATDKIIDINSGADKSLLDFQWVADAEIY